MRAFLLPLEPPNYNSKWNNIRGQYIVRHLMTYTGGTPNARACIEHLRSIGALVDVYSNEWLAANPDYGGFYPEDLDEYQRKSKGACAGHLMIISTSLHRDQVAELLTAVYAPFADIFEPNGHHKPDLVLINLATQQILCAGLRRKNSFFGFAVGNDQVRLSDGDIDLVLRDWNTTELSAQKIATKRYMQEFCKYDYARVIPSLLESLYEFGCNARGWDNLPLNPELIQSIINAGPDADGFFDVDGDQITQEALTEMVQDFAHYEEIGNEHLHTLQTYFPELTWSDLNTQDY